MNKDTLRKFYENMLPILGLYIGDDDYLNTFYLDEDQERQPIPLLVNNLPVIFPTDAVLREGKWKDRVGFHPLSESSTRGISPMLLNMGTSLRYKIGQAIFYIGTALINVAKDSRDGTVKNLPVGLVEALGTLPKTVDAKTLAFFSKIIANSNDTDQALVKVCIKRNGSILGTDYKRTTSIYFPIYEQLVEAIEKKEGEFWGVNAARKSDLIVVKEILEIILPDISDENRYSAGTFVSIAPYLDSVLQAAVKVQDSLNSCLELLDKHVSSAVRSSYQADTSWFEEEIVLRDIKNVIPPLRFNEGDITEDEQKERESDTERVKPRRTESSSEIPDFGTKTSNGIRRTSEQKVSDGAPKLGRRHRDNTLTDEERYDPERSERRMSSSYDDDEDWRRDRNRRDRDRGGRDRGRTRGGRERTRDDYDDYDDRPSRRSRRRDDRDDYDDRRSSGGGWLERNRERRDSEEDRRSRRRR